MSRFEEVAEGQACVLHTLGASSDAYPVLLGTQQMFANDDCDFEKAPYSLSFSSERWRGGPGMGEKVERCFSSSLLAFAVVNLPRKQT